MIRTSNAALLTFISTCIGREKEGTYVEGRYERDGHAAAACAGECVLGAREEGGMVEIVGAVGVGWSESESISSQSWYSAACTLFIPRVRSSESISFQS